MDRECAELFQDEESYERNRKKRGEKTIGNKAQTSQTTMGLPGRVFISIA